MAKLSGGLLGNVSGKIGGIVFGSARSPEGKVNTARNYVKPANPNTSGQQEQRGYFGAAVDIVRRLGSALYTDDWNRAVAQNPGFQSLQSTILKARGTDPEFAVPAEVNLGTLHSPSSVSDTAGASANEVKVMWATDNGDNGHAEDPVVVFAYPKDNTKSNGTARSVGVASREDGVAGVTLNVGYAGEDCVFGIYFRGSGSSVGLLSPAFFGSVTSKT